MVSVFGSMCRDKNKLCVVKCEGYSGKFLCELFVVQSEGYSVKCLWYSLKGKVLCEIFVVHYAGDSSVSLFSAMKSDFTLLFLFYFIVVTGPISFPVIFIHSQCIVYDLVFFCFSIFCKEIFSLLL